MATPQLKYVTAAEAAATLGISSATLYSYVSRGQIRSEPVDGDSRARRYRADDVAALVARRVHRHHPEQVAQEALDWGAPVISSALTLIDDERLYYRGHDVLHLASTVTFEAVIALLWTGDLQAADRLFPMPRGPTALPAEMQSLNNLPLMTRLTIALAAAEAHDLAAHDLRPVALVRTGGRVLDVMMAVLAPTNEGDLIAQRLAIAWTSAGSPSAAERELVNSALILCADHELNASSFAARVVASTEATLYSVVIGGLAALQGAKHGGGTSRALALLDELLRSANIHEAVADRLRRGERLPGFGHRLYPTGDPRARYLLAKVRQYKAQSPVIQVADALIDLAQSCIDQAPNVDLALAVLARSLNWPGETALALFALGRLAGWVGHAIEQYAVGQLIRPRAAYRGPLPPL